MIDEPKGRGTEGGGWDKRRKGKDKCYREGTRTKDSAKEKSWLCAGLQGEDRESEGASIIGE